MPHVEAGTTCSSPKLVKRRLLSLLTIGRRYRSSESFDFVAVRRGRGPDSLLYNENGHHRRGLGNVRQVPWKRRVSSTGHAEPNSGLTYNVLQLIVRVCSYLQRQAFSELLDGPEERHWLKRFSRVFAHGLREKRACTLVANCSACRGFCLSNQMRTLTRRRIECDTGPPAPPHSAQCTSTRLQYHPP